MNIGGVFNINRSLPPNSLSSSLSHYALLARIINLANKISPKSRKFCLPFETGNNKKCARDFCFAIALSLFPTHYTNEKKRSIK